MKKLFESELDCCGCETCVNVCPKSAITMCEDAIGFRYPKIDAEKCIDCGACIKKCDFQKTKLNKALLTYLVKLGQSLVC